MSDRYWHEFCFTGPEQAEGLIDAAEAAGYSFEFGASQPDESFVGLPVQLEGARDEIARLRSRLTEYVLKELGPGTEVVLRIGGSERKGRLARLHDDVVYLDGDFDGIPVADIDDVLLEMSTEGPE